MAKAHAWGGPESPIETSNKLGGAYAFYIQIDFHNIFSMDRLFPILFF